jgi:hypothetical protein
MKRFWMALAAALTLSAVIMLGIILGQSFVRQPVSLFLAFQDEPTEYSQSEANQWRNRLLQFTQERHVSDNSESSALAKPVYQAIMELATQQPALLSDPDLAATTSEVIKYRVTRGVDPEGAPSPSQICLALRWTPVRLQRLAVSCREALADGDNAAGESFVQSERDGLIIIGAGKALRQAIKSYQSNPFAPELISSAAKALADAGHYEAAAQLSDELIQIDASKATKLQSALARLRGLTHEAHNLP